MCQTNEDGDVDYTRFARYISSGFQNDVEEADYFASRHKAAVTSSTEGQDQSLHPFESTHHLDVAEEQRQLLKDYRRNLADLYDQFDHSKSTTIDLR